MGSFWNVLNELRFSTDLLLCFTRYQVIAEILITVDEINSGECDFVMLFSGATRCSDISMA